jgi:hypothetical protein
MDILAIRLGGGGDDDDQHHQAAHWRHGNASAEPPIDFAPTAHGRPPPSPGAPYEAHFLRHSIKAPLD